MEFVLVPAGGFSMGSTDPLDNCGQTVATIWTPIASPVHAVTFASAFYVGKTDITQAQWKAVQGATNNLSKFIGDTLPVDSVSWNDIRATAGFLETLNAALPGYGFRLPSEAEFEYTCRAGTTTAYFFGADATDLSTYAWWQNNSGSETKAVGTKAPNPWGLYDIVGNVWQWLEDDRHDDYLGAPTDGSAWVDSPTRNSARLIRGGSWFDSHVDESYRSAIRSGQFPNSALGGVFGFRIVMALPSSH